MALEIVVGTQWGDEGKGRVVDMLSAGAAIVARYNGGDNAGHTVTVGSTTFKLHLLPSGMIHPETMGILGTGVVINPATLLKEMDMLRSRGLEVTPQRLRLSFAAHLITPVHQALDAAQEAARGKDQLGTTGRGIGPAYTDRASRRGLRAMDLLDLDQFAEKFKVHIAAANLALVNLYHAEPLDGAALLPEYLNFARQLQPYVDDVGRQVQAALAEGKRVLAEGAQGTLLDIDLGTYPFVTSSSSLAPAALTGLGIGIMPVGRIIGVTKAFQTRVGAGPFPTEVMDENAERLRGTGSKPWDEFGTTTGRPRRVGWLDGVLLRYAVRINGVTEQTLTKMDVLSGLPVQRICVAYRTGDKIWDHLPMGPADLSTFEAVYEDLPSWDADLTGIRTWEELPSAAKQYVCRVEEVSGVPVSYISVGPERDQVIERSV
ncbi:MAG: adenylosuccinate synthase [Anaerolineaceae bacterium]|nr:adenylosuccinate synthase [Anaerolineaceae bacterium]